MYLLSELVEEPQALDGVWDWVTSPVQQTKALLAERAVEKAAEEAKKKAVQEEEWKRSGQPWSKKADVMLTVAKWGIITVPLAIVFVSIMPLLRGTGMALSGAGKALGGVGDAAREGAETVRAVRGRAARRNPAALPSFAARHRRLGVLSLVFGMEARRAASVTVRMNLEGAGLACLDLFQTPYARTEARLSASAGRFRRHLGRWEREIRRARAAGDQAREAFATGYWQTYAAGIAFLEDPDQAEPAVRAA